MRYILTLLKPNNSFCEEPNEMILGHYSLFALQIFRLNRFVCLLCSKTDSYSFISVFSFRWIKSVCEGCGQVSSKSSSSSVTAILNAEASRTQSRRCETWSTPPVTSPWVTPCLCPHSPPPIWELTSRSGTYGAVLSVWTAFALGCSPGGFGMYKALTGSFSVSIVWKCFLNLPCLF